ncbi:MAG: sulfatase [Phycisphaerales bacterium]|nr:sulfatase [Phycisphaerales bacterium]
MRAPALRTIAVLFSLLMVGAAHAQASSRRPNVLLFLVDDLGWSDTSVPMSGDANPLNRRWHTPNVERLAARGMRFGNAYASAPVCTPTRTSIMTGRSPGQSHITYWTLNRDRDTSANFPGLRPPAWRVNGLDADETTLPKLLAAAGYQTIHVGKAHFGANDTPTADPKVVGFAVNIAGHAAGGPASYLGTQRFSLAGREGKDPSDPAGKPSVWDVPGLDAYHGQEIFLTEALALEASKAIEQAVGAGKPFFMNFAPYAVHAPIMANQRYLDRYADLDEREAAYATMIESVDAALGTLVETIDRLGVLDTTVIVFASDNGGLSAHARGAAPGGGTRHVHNAPLRSGKGSAYEGGIRVPQVVAWPGVTAAGSHCDVPVVSHDLFPTILAIAGVDVPASHLAALEGIDLGPLLRGDPEAAAAMGDRPLLWNQPHFWGVEGPGIEPFTAIRQGKWKLIWFHGDRRFELYDLENDPGENTNLAPYRPALVKRLTEVMAAWIEARNVQLSLDATSGDPVRLER